MTSESVCTLLRIAWNQYLVHTNKVLNPLICRGKITNIASGCGRPKAKAKQATETSNTAKNRKSALLLIRQFSVIAGQRVWRACQIVSWYRRLYGETFLHHVLDASFLRHCRNSKILVLLSATSMFNWERDGVSNTELLSALSEMELMKSLADDAVNSVKQQAISAAEGWEMFVNRPHIKVWRRFMKDFGLFEYRVYGSFTDIKPRAFYDTEMDLKFWSGWDPHSIRVDIIDTDDDSNSEVIHWVYKYPYPMHPRDYCFVRRGIVNHEINKMVIRARAVVHPKCPEVPNIVRVKQYESQLVVIPNTTFDENGFGFYLTYFDDPQSQIPTIAYNWLASSGVLDFVERLHEASKVMQDRTSKGYVPKGRSAPQAK